MKDIRRNEIISEKQIIITAGPTYLDIDAYACSVALRDLLVLQGKNAIAYSAAPCNYSICPSLIKPGQMETHLPEDICLDQVSYIIVDVSDPGFLENSIPLDQVVEIYDHHTGFENYWQERIGKNAHIEFIGAAATQIYRLWKKSGLLEQMEKDTALLLIAAILDNTLNLTSSNTTQEDKDAFEQLCAKAHVDKDWRASYFSEVQKSVEADLKNAMFGDIKTIKNDPVLPSKVAQLCVWDADSILAKLAKICQWFMEDADSWLINIIDIKHHCSYFVCNDSLRQEKIEEIFDVFFENGVAQTIKPYLRKEIIKKIQHYKALNVEENQ